MFSLILFTEIYFLRKTIKGSYAEHFILKLHLISPSRRIANLTMNQSKRFISFISSTLFIKYNIWLVYNVDHLFNI